MLVRLLRATVATLAVAVALASCASGIVRRGTPAVLEMINAGDATALADVSAAPFMLDDELLVRAADVAEFWELATASGLRVEPVSIEVGPVERDAEAYADTMDVRTFLTERLPRRARLVRVVKVDGSVLLLMEPAPGGAVPLVHGFKGPLS